MPAEALEARPVREALDDQMDELLWWCVAWVSEIESSALSALGAAHVHAHRVARSATGRRWRPAS